MENIYEIIEKHFQNQTSVEEEMLVSKFKAEHQQEYQLLKQLWWSNAKLAINDFDSQLAWRNILAKAHKQKAQTVSFSIKIRRVAAIAALLIVGSFFAYLLVEKQTSKETFVETTTEFNQTNKVILADGSTVWLNRNSKIYYPKEFSRKTRHVKLKGEAFFEVTKNPNKPFIVETDHSEIKVLGTSFNINTDSLQTAVSVSTGKVNVKSAYSKSSIILTPNELAIVTKSDLLKSQITNPNYLSWKTGVFFFEDTPLETVARDLNTFYPKPIVLYSKNQTQHFTASFDNAKLEDIVEILELTYQITIEETPSSYEIH